MAGMTRAAAGGGRAPRSAVAASTVPATASSARLTIFSRRTSRCTCGTARQRLTAPSKAIRTTRALLNREHAAVAGVQQICPFGELLQGARSASQYDDEKAETGNRREPQDAAPAACPESCPAFRSGARQARQSTRPPPRNAATAWQPRRRHFPAQRRHDRRRREPPSPSPRRRRRLSLRRAAVASRDAATAANVVAMAAVATAAARHMSARPTAVPRNGSHATPAACFCAVASNATPQVDITAPATPSHGFCVPPKRPASAAAAPTSAIRPTRRIQRPATSSRDIATAATRVERGSGDILTPKAYDPAVGCPSIADTTRQFTV